MASTYKQVSYGSTGSSVKELQNLLNQHGYGLDEDGIFGTKTQAAVRDYQKKNGLLLDGIAGKETWGSLVGASSAAAQAGESMYKGSVSRNTMTALANLEQGYQPSDAVETALAAKKSVEAMRPADYVSGFDEQLKTLYGEIANRAAFRYDPEEDLAYQNYARQYARQGKLAMEDTMGKAAGLTGGYGSSYAQTAAQQAYGSYMEKLQDILPQMQQSAWENYKSQGEALLKRYDLLKGQERDEYDRWQDEVAAWQKAVDSAKSEYESVSAADLKNYQMLLDYYADKAALEVKAAQSGVSIPSASSSIGNTASLSSVAGESLERAMGNYLKSGNAEEAAKLYAQYQQRMTPAQKKTFAALFAGYGQSLA